ncbi:lactonase family protein [Variovorax sp. OV329]|uniref:lactonase family protein n=1 Tax=Variovorax sp. OV329 TaxID=1882825 RepID=UPI0008EC67BA|nr:lactonase family protein [Variovorax sp. OV329]SFN24053.1 6-phosphogluconolactonase, cycloisomerase 2 family [Variovorax sp. OV329]
MYAYVGSRTTKERNARGEGISIFRFDPERGTLQLVGIEKGLVNPSFLALSRDGNFLYTVHGDESEVSAFKVDRQTGRLDFLNRQSTQGKNPVHLAFDPSGRYLVISNHIGASLAVVPVNADGTLAPLTQLVKLEGPIGPHRAEQKQAKPHFNPFDPSGRFVVVPDKGLDRVFSFRFEQGQLVPAEKAFAVTRETAGPRHLAFHPKSPWAYVVNELDSTVTAYRFDASTGALDAFQIVSSLPDSFIGNSRASEIEVDASGRFLYASNRGYDCVAVFAIDSATGRLSFQGAQQTSGKTPRFFALAPDGRFMFALNEDSDSIETLAVDSKTGLLEPTGARVSSGSPVCMVFSA